MVYAFNFICVFAHSPRRSKRLLLQARIRRGRAQVLWSANLAEMILGLEVYLFFSSSCVYVCVCAATPDKKKSGGKAQPKKEQSVSGNIAHGCVD